METHKHILAMPNFPAFSYDKLSTIFLNFTFKHTKRREGHKWLVW